MCHFPDEIFEVIEMCGSPGVMIVHVFDHAGKTAYSSIMQNPVIINYEKNNEDHW